jgi:phosphatidylserine/phosphatidylglycerophosphate/cardiolipin synthase-like enzyme
MINKKILITMLLATAFKAVCTSDPNSVLLQEFDYVKHSALNGWFNDKSLQTELDQRTNSMAHHGNKVTLLVNGVNSLPLRKQNLENADVIMIKTYEFHDTQQSTLELLDILTNRAQAGAKIFIQFDVKGTATATDIYDILSGKMSPILPNLVKLQKVNPNNVFIIPTSVPQKYVEYLEVTLDIFCPIDHEKYFITWNSKKPQEPVKIIMGGMNIGDHYLLGETKDTNGNFIRLPAYNNGFSYRDTDVEVIGPVTADIIQTYIDRIGYYALNQNPYFKKNILPTLKNALAQLPLIQQEMFLNKKYAFPENAGHAFVRFVNNAPNQAVTKQHNILRTWSLLMRSIPSGKTVKATSWVFYPPGAIQSDMRLAANRGVQINILANCPGADDPDVSTGIVKAMRPLYPNLLKKTPNMKIYEWHGNDELTGVNYIHQKVSSFGDDSCDPFIVGSANMDSASLIHNGEGILLIQDKGVKKQFDSMFANDFNQHIVTPFTSQDAQKITWKEKIYAYIFSYLRNLL